MTPEPATPPGGEPRLSDEERERRLRAAHDMVSDLCHQRRKWLMSIPARPDHDPDIVIGDGLRAGDEAQRELRALRADLKKAEARAEALREALEEIAQGIGPYSMDRLKHAENTIEYMKFTARAALKDGQP